MECKNELPLAEPYTELAHLLFMLQMAYINSTSVDVKGLKVKVDELIAFIHARNIIEKITI